MGKIVFSRRASRQNKTSQATRLTLMRRYDGCSVVSFGRRWIAETTTTSPSCNYTVSPLQGSYADQSFEGEMGAQVSILLHLNAETFWTLSKSSTVTAFFKSVTTLRVDLRGCKLSVVRSPIACDADSEEVPRIPISHTRDGNLWFGSDLCGSSPRERLIARS